MSSSIRSHLGKAVFLAILFGVSGPVTVHATLQQPAAADTSFQFNIPITSFSSAIESFRSTTGWTVTVEARSLNGVSTVRPLTGRFTPVEALQRLVSGTSLGLLVTGDRSASIQPQAVTVAGVTVMGTDGAYTTGVTRTATKTVTLLRDVPQSIAVVTSNVIADQKMSGLADLVRYVPGVTMGQGEGNRDQPTIRGNSGNGDLFVDGVRDDTEYLRDLYNVDRVEVPKGSNAMIFGRAGGGGLINRVTKQADWSPLQSLMVQGGSHNNRRSELDLGSGVSDRVAVRLMGIYENSDSYRQGLNVERYGVTPTATIALGNRTVVRATYEHFRDYRTADRGIPSFQGVPFSTNSSTFFGDPNTSYSKVDVNAGNATLEHQFGPNIKFRNHLRYADYDKIYQNVFPGALNSAGTTVAISAYNNQILRANLFNQTDLTGSIHTGGVKHVWLLGAEYGHQSSDAFRNTGYFNGTATSLNVSAAAPSTAGTPVTFRQSATDADAHTTAVVMSGYVQDQIELTPQLLAVAGVRVENFDLKYHNNRTNVDLARSDRMVSPRLGLVVKPMQLISLYGSYSVSFLPSSGAQFTSLTVTTETLEPEEFNNYEVGAKWDPTADLSLTAAGYILDRTNTSAPDPTDPTHTIQTGAQRSKGIELTAAGRVLPAWQVLLGYNFQEVAITSRTAAAQPGQIPALSPKHTASMWNRYQVTPFLGIGLGVLYQDEMFAGIDNTVTLPSFTRADAAMMVRVTDNLQAQVNVENLLDEDYFSTAHSNNNITPGAPRSLKAGFTVTY